MKRDTKRSQGNTLTTLALASLLPMTVATGSVHAEAETVADAIKSGKASLNFRLRYEDVDQDNALDDAEGMTLRTLLGYTTDSYRGLSGTLEFEDSRQLFGIADYNDGIGNGAGNSVIADPETTEVDQAFLKYSGSQGSIKAGRQVIAYGNQRFVGHVGWRQDRQTFDALSAQYTGVENLAVDYAYVVKRNRIFAEVRDVKSDDHLLQAAYTLKPGTLSAYALLLDEDSTSNALDTYGLRFSGATPVEDLKLLYTAEYAYQEAEPQNAQASYYNFEAGVVVSGITAKLGFEVLGSDDGNYGFSTPLATGHAFNGWADQFLATPAQGLEDLSLSVAGAVAGGNWSLIYHDFSANESTAGVDDLGSEIDAVFTRPFAEHYVAGIKYAAYMAGDGAFVDTDKLWVFVTANF